MSSVLFLLLALGLSALGTAVLVWRNRQPNRIETGINEFHREMRALAPDWGARVDDHDLVTSDHSLRSMLERAGVELIGYRKLRDLQRAA